MTTRLQKQMIVDASWLLGVLVVGGLALGSTMKKLQSQRSAVNEQRSQLSLKETRLTDEMSAHARLTDLTQAKGRLDEADSMVADEARRISLISSIAREANMRVVALRSGTSRPTTDAAVLAKRHELVAVGGYRDLAGFIDALQDADGSVAIDTIKVSPVMAPAASRPGNRRRDDAPALTDREPKIDAHQLRVSLEILWLGISEDFDALREAKDS